MEDGPADLVRLQTPVQRFGAQAIGVQFFQCLAGGRFGRHQPGPGQRLHQAFLAPDETVAPPPGRTRIPAIGGQRGLGLRVPSRLVIRCENTDPGIENAAGSALIVQTHGTPADGIGAKIESQAVGHASPHFCCGKQLTPNSGRMTIFAGSLKLSRLEIEGHPLTSPLRAQNLSSFEETRGGFRPAVVVSGAGPGGSVPSP